MRPPHYNEVVTLACFFFFWPATLQAGQTDEFVKQLDLIHRKSETDNILVSAVAVNNPSWLVLWVSFGAISWMLCSRRQQALEHKQRPLVVGITGATRSGKSTVARSLFQEFESPNRFVGLVQLDNYRKFTLRGGERIVDAMGRRNWEDPENIAWKEFEAAVDQVVLQASHSQDRAIVFLEGFCLLFSPLVRDRLDSVLWIEIDYATCRERRKTALCPMPKGWQFSEYFDKVLWPAYESYKQMSTTQMTSELLLRSTDMIDGTLPPQDVLEMASRLIRSQC